VEHDARSNALAARPEPPEHQRREEHRQSIRVDLRREVPEREQRGGDQHAPAQLRSQDLHPRLPGVVERGLQVPSIEGFLGQRDHQELTEHIVAERGQRAGHEGVSGLPPP
jgi:hypothetical protein